MLEKFQLKIMLLQNSMIKDIFMHVTTLKQNFEIKLNSHLRPKFAVIADRL